MNYLIKIIPFVLVASLSAQLVPLSQAIPSLIIDLQYATKNNIVQEPIYDADFVCCADTRMIEALKKAQHQLQLQGFGLKIWDAFQPREQLEKIWRLLSDARYITDPHRGDAHTRGMAVDVTLVDNATLQEVEMPTAFDCITIKSLASCTDISAAAQQHRNILYEAMTKSGFVQPEGSSWWHFELPE